MNNIAIINTSKDPWFNLATEEYLLNSKSEYDNILFLWQNANTVVIGKNQNAWRECKTELLEREGGKLARRSTGGGAVYHDDGNLNFSFITSKSRHSFEYQAKVIINAVKEFNIQAYVNGRNDIITDKGKFSGNAFTFKKDRALHHGTILMDTDREKLGRYLQVSKEKMQAKGIKSVQSRIVNLTEHNPDITMDKLKSAVANAFFDQYGNGQIIDETKGDNLFIGLLNKKAIDDLYNIYSSWDFRYGEAPVFDIEWENRFIWGGLEIHLNVKNGIVENSRIYSDALDERFIESLNDCFIGVRFVKLDMAKAVTDKYPGNQMASDIAAFLTDKEF